MKRNDWNDYYNLLKEFVLKNGHAYVPFKYVVEKDGIEYALGYWLCMQRASYNGKTRKYKLTEEKIKLLEDIGMDWNGHNNKETRIPDKWMEMYDIAKEYYEEKGNLCVSLDHVVIKNDKKYNLGSWISTQSFTYNGKNKCKLNPKQIDLLNNIGMIWDKKNSEDYIPNKWMEMYNIAKEYYEKNGNLFVPSDYVVNDSNGEKINLYNWVLSQRYKHDENSKYPLKPKQIELLNEIGMAWKGWYRDDDYIPDKWIAMYNIAKEYYKEFGNLCVPLNYLVKDSNDEIVNLYNWVITQRVNYDENSKYHLNKKQIDMLNEIGMIWNIKAYKELWKKYRDIFKKYKKGYIFQNDKEYLKSVGIDITTDRSILIDDKYIIEKANSVVRKKQ